MDLNMRNNGKVYSRFYRQTQERAAISERRASDEEREWCGVSKTDGQRIDPDMFRTTVMPPGSKFQTAVTVDQRSADPYRKDGTEKHR
jgi:hypothetical protein